MSIKVESVNYIFIYLILRVYLMEDLISLRHYLEEDKILKKNIKSLKSMTKPKHLSKKEIKKKIPKRALSPQLSLQTTISEEYRFTKVQPKIIYKKQQREKVLKRPKKLSVISVSSNHSQIIEANISINKKTSKVFGQRSQSNFDKSQNQVFRSCCS